MSTENPKILLHKGEGGQRPDEGVLVLCISVSYPFNPFQGEEIVLKILTDNPER